MTRKVAICVTYGKWCQRSPIYGFSLPCLSKLWIPFRNQISDFCWKFFYLHIFIFFWFWDTILS